MTPLNKFIILLELSSTFTADNFVPSEMELDVYTCLIVILM